MLQPILKTKKPKTIEERLDVVEGKVQANSDTLKENQDDIKEILKTIREWAPDVMFCTKEAMRLGTIAAEDKMELADILENMATYMKKRAEKILSGK